MPRIVLATYGSLGDLHPAIALAAGLSARGHQIVIGTSENYRAKVEGLGFAFHPLRPDLLAQGEHIVAEIMDGHRGTRRLLRDYLFPAVRAMHADLAPLMARADLLITSELVFAAPLLAATCGIRWASYQLAPVSLFSRHDPPELPVLAALRRLQRTGWLHPLVKLAAKAVMHSWWRPVRELRAELGLPPGENPLFEGKYSPALNLALFSSVLQRPQPDWPPQTVQTGFLFFDEDRPGDGHTGWPEPVRDFLAAGEPPIVFTLGSAAIYTPGNFYEESARAAELLGRRAILLLGPNNAAPPGLPASILPCAYLPYARIFPHAAAIVHQGGVGTTAQALRSGRPMLVVPFAHDQFDNAARVTRLGVGRSLARSRYRAANVARQLGALLAEGQAAAAGSRVAERVRAETGVKLACDALEALLRRERT